jgi:vanillate O-demethylase monooxygenase subunit
MDNFMAYDYLLPGILLMQTGVFPLGTAKACDFGYPDLSRAVGSLSFTSQAVTP